MLKNNKGFSLSLVIAIMAITGVLVATVIVIVTANYNMKKSQKEVDNNKYNAEDGLNAIVADLQEFCEKQLEDSYQKSLYLDGLSDNEQLNIRFKTLYIKQLYYYLGEGDKETLNNKLNEFLTNDIKEGEGTNNFAKYCTYMNQASVDNPKVTNESGEELVYPFLYIHNIGVTFNSPDTSRESIITDIRIDAPDLFDGATTNNDDIAGEYGKFSLVTDKTIDIIGWSRIRGNTYGGGHTDEKGVYTDGYSIGKSSDCTADITTDKMITRGDITVYDTDASTLTDIMPYSGDLVNIYANNIYTKHGNGTNTVTSKHNCFQAYANFYIRGDTMLNRPYMCGLFHGNYYGFTKDSAFNINGRNVNADLSDLSTLLLAGTSYLDIPVNEGDNTSVQIGDSLTGKFSQSVYMIPAECIYYVEKTDDSFKKESIGNPISKSLMDSSTIVLTKNASIEDTITADGKYIVLDYYKFKEKNNIDLYDYIDESSNHGMSSITPIYSNQKSAENGIRTYLYFKFKNTEKASEYLRRFDSTFQGYVNSKSKDFSYGNISLSNDTVLYTVGNVLANKNGKLSIHANTETIDSNVILQNEEAINKDYNSIASTLLPYNKSLVDSYNDSCFDYVINKSLISEHKGYDNLNTNEHQDSAKVGDSDSTHTYTSSNIVIEGTDIDFEGNKVDVLVCDGDVKIQNDMNGLIITTGKVEFNLGVTFKGTVLAKNGIFINESTISSETSTGSILYWLLSTYENKNKVSQAFNLLKTDDEEDEIPKNAIQISYKNWMVY